MTCVARQTKKVADLRGELCRLWQEYEREKAILEDVSAKDLQRRAAAEKPNHESTKNLKLRCSSASDLAVPEDEWELISSQICAEVASVESK